MGIHKEQISGGFIAGAVLIALGIALFLGNLGLLPYDGIAALWPLAFVFWGTLGVIRARSVAAAVYPVTAIVAGIILILSAFGVIRHVSVFSLWPLVLIAAGVLAMTSGLTFRDLSAKFTSGTTQNRVQEFAVFSGVKRRIETLAFEGGELSCLFGGVEIDLRRASMIADATLDANAMFGGIELRIPEEWKVVIQGFAAFGAYEDKTLPPRPEPGQQPPVLTIRGTTAFGGVSITN